MATRSKSIQLTNTLSIQQRGDFLYYARRCVMRENAAITNLRAHLQYRDRLYMRAMDYTDAQIKALAANRAGDANRIQNMQVPIVMPQVESATAYQASVYLGSDPIFGVVAAPESMSAAMQFETSLSYQATRAGWSRELIKSFRNGMKFNFAPTVCTWKNLPRKQIVTDTTPEYAGRARLQVDQTDGANFIKAIDPYNCFLDMSVPPAELHNVGEFFGYHEILPRVSLMRLVQSLDSSKTSSIREAYNSNTASFYNDGDASGMYYFQPVLNRLSSMGSIQQLTTNWGAWAGLLSSGKDKYDFKQNYQVTHFFCRACPADFGGNGYIPKVYYAIIVNWCHVIYVEEMNVGHDFLPCFIMQPFEDGNMYQTQSMVDNAAPFQEMSSALWNATIESKRRQIFDRLIYNPRHIDKKDIDPASAVARIPLRNMTMAKDGGEIGRAIYQIPYRDDNAGVNLQMSEMISGMADQAVGQNKVDRGQFQPGNKTRTEFSTVQQNSNSRQQLASLTIQGQFMTPLKETIKSNTLQFSNPQRLLSKDKKQEIAVDPIAMRNATMEFRLTDGMMPMDKMLNPELLMVFLQTAQAIPAVATEYDIMGMFIYWAKLNGAIWLDDFQRNPQQQQQFLQTIRQTQAAATPPEPAVAA